MSPVFATKRRAEEFNTLVESSTEALADARYSEALALVDHLRELEPPAPRPDFTLALREQLMAAADTVLLPAPDRASDTARLALPPRRTARDRRIAAAVGAAAIIGASTSVAVAAQSALPGEMLYPVKRLLENAQTEAHLSEAGKGASLLSNATDRLAEVTELSRTSDLDEASTIADTLSAFSEQSLAASDLLLDDYEQTGDRSSVEGLNDFTASSMETLAQLEAVLPPGTRDELQYAVQVLTQIDAAASQACPSCRGGLEQIPAALLAAGELAEPSVTYVSPPLVEDDSTSGDGRGPARRATTGPAAPAATAAPTRSTRPTCRRPVTGRPSTTRRGRSTTSSTASPVRAASRRPAEATAMVAAMVAVASSTTPWTRSRTSST